MNRTFAAVAVFCVAACSTTIDATHYSQTCSVDGDCSPVYSGQLCDACRCPNAAINTSDLARYNADQSTLLGHCGLQRGIACDCVQATAHCDAGACTVTHP
jgi:hypothetical protein